MKEVKVNAFEELAMNEMMAVDGGGPATVVGNFISRAYSKPVTYKKHDKGSTFEVTRPANKTMVKVGKVIVAIDNFF